MIKTEAKESDMIKKESIPSEVYTVAEIQKILNISKNIAYDLVKENLFPVIKIKSVFRIPKKSFHMWLDNITTDEIKTE